MSFSNPAVLRGSYVNRSALGRLGRILGIDPCTSDYYNLSEVVDHVDVFISHNWATPRQSKFLVLACYFNFIPAIVGAFLIGAVLAVLTAAGVLPTIALAGGTGEFRASVWCQLGGLATFVLVLFCWQDAGRLIGCRGKLVFLDKVCVHQTDEELKQEGIEHVAAFLYYSWSILICYSDVYLQRLWTVYEVACFLMLHPGSAMHVRHVQLPRFVLGSITIGCAYSVVWHALHLRTVQEVNPLSGTIGDIVLTSVIALPAIAAGCVVLFGLALERLRILEHVRRFRIAGAKCASEGDRSAVQKNIVAFMKYHGRVEQSSSDAFVFEEFERIVHTEVPLLFSASLGRVGFPFHIAAAISLQYALESLDNLGTGVMEGHLPWDLALATAYKLTIVLAVGPLAAAIGISIAESSSSRANLGCKATVCAMTIALTAFLGGSFFLFRVLFLRARDSIDGGIVLLAVAVGFHVAAMMVYRPQGPIGHMKYHRRLRGNQDRPKPLRSVSFD